MKKFVSGFRRYVALLIVVLAVTTIIISSEQTTTSEGICTIFNAGGEWTFGTGS